MAIVASLLNPVSATGVRYQSTSTTVIDLIVVAHEDDWQLFMGDAVAKRAKSGARVVFVYLTAGDVGRDSVYWRTRERAAMASAAQLVPTVGGSATASCGETNASGHAIMRCMLANSSSWFLRLPDGRRSGTGYKTHAFQSLRKLRNHRISVINAVDGSTTYRGWADLLSTVRAIIVSESAGTVSLHSNDPSILVNPHDHFDHRMAGRLTRDIEQLEHRTANYYLGYALAARDDNLPQTEVQMKTRLFRSYDSVMVAVNRNWSALAEHRTFYSECLRRTYLRRSSRATETRSPAPDMR